YLLEPSEFLYENCKSSSLLGLQHLFRRETGSTKHEPRQIPLSGSASRRISSYLCSQCLVVAAGVVDGIAAESLDRLSSASIGLPLMYSTTSASS
ncbi:hypothetical protein PMAYCL1PPCAC_09777, partial [Pristionchus mayeri]